MAWAAVNGIQLYYESHGSGAETIVFAHGGGGNHLSWWQQVPYFRDKYRCVVFDHRGFGQSVEVPDGPGGAAFPDDLRGLMDHLGVEKAFLAGQSMGGRTCLGFTIAYPERVKGLVMADTTGTIEEPELMRLRQAVRANEPSPPRLEGRVYSEAFMREQPALVFLYHSLVALNPPREQTFDIGTRAVAERFVATPEKLASLKVPVLFIAGALDVLATPEIVRRAASLVPGARIFEVPGAGHSPYFEDAATWNRAVGEFFASVEG
jgi:3-oxoadipate enol-lactonase